MPMPGLCVHGVAEMVRRCALVITCPPRVKLFTDAQLIARRSRKGATDPPRMRPYPVRKEPCCSHEQNQSIPHPPHPMVLRQGGFCKMYRARVERLLCKIDAKPLDVEGAVWINFAHGSSRAPCAQDTVSPRIVARCHHGPYNFR
jgi:hypothetical protein